MNGYVASGNMYGNTRVFSNPFAGMQTKPFKTSVNKLYDFMLQKCLNGTKEYDDTDDWDSLDFAMLRHMQEEIDETNPLCVFKEDDAYYFNDSKGIRRIDKYESN